LLSGRSKVDFTKSAPTVAGKRECLHAREASATVGAKEIGLRLYPTFQSRALHEESL